jgi:prepilin-type processing-associated H-X9-DG protein
MRIFPAALINENQPLKRLSDGISKTLMVAEIRTRDNELDSRGAWVAAFRGGSTLAFDMHSAIVPDVSPSFVNKRNAPYSPELYNNVEPGLPPNTGESWNNKDYIASIGPDTAAAGLEKMPCTTQTNNRSAAAPRSNHSGGVNASQCDGSVIFIADDIDQFLMARMISINDGEGLVEGKK